MKKTHRNSNAIFSFNRLSQWIASPLALAAMTLSAGLASAQAPVFLPSITAVAGNRATGYTGDGNDALLATLSNNLSAVTTDPAGNIYIADTGNSVVRRVDAITGIITTVAGTGVAGYNATQDNGPGIAAQLNKPQAVRYHQGALFIADTTNNRIRRLDLTSGIITTFAGGGPTALVSGNQGSVLATGITVPAPQDIAFDGLGNLFFSQQGGTGRVNRVSLSTHLAYFFAGNGKSGNTGDGGDPTAASFNGPFGIAVDGQNNVYVADATNHQIRKINVTTNTISTYAGGATAVCTEATDTLGDGCTGLQTTFGQLDHISIDGLGNIYVVDSTNNRVRKIAPAGDGTAGLVTTVLGTGATPSGADGGYVADTPIGNPWDVQFTPAGDMLVAERTISSVRIVRSTSLLPSTAVASTSAAVNVLALTQQATGTFSLPGTTEFVGATPVCIAAVNITGTVCSYSLTLTPSLAGLRSNPLQFTDANGSAVQGMAGIGLAPAASLLPGMISAYAGTGIAGATGDAGAAASARLNMPSAAAIDGQGNLYIADTGNNEVRKVTPGGIISRIAGSGSIGATGDGAAATLATLNAPQGIAVDTAGNVYIADTGNNKIRYVDAVSGNISTLAGTDTVGYTGDNAAPTAATFSGPTGLFLTPAGLLYIADTGNSVVRTLALHNSLLTTFAGSVTAGFNGDGGPANAAQLQNPTGVAADASGNLFIADTGNNRIREVSGYGIINTIAGQQGGGYLGDGLATSTELFNPSGLAVDAAGNLYIADTLNQRIRIIAKGQIATIAGTGTTGSTGDTGSAGVATLSGSKAVALDGSGNLYIADTGNNRIREIAVGSNALSFKTVNPMEKAPVQTVSLYNSGNQSLSLNSFTVPNGYIEQSSASGVDCTSAPLSLNAGESCNLNTVFNPPTTGTYNSTITLADNAQTASSTQTIALTASSAIVFTPTVTLPNSAVAGSTIAATVVVTNPNFTYTGTLHFTSTDPQATLPADYTYQTSEAGSHSFSFIFRTAGSQCVTVTDTTDSAVEATSCVNITASVATSIAINSGNMQSANVSSTYSSLLVALVTDAYGNPIPNAQVTFTAVANGAVSGAFTVGSASQATDTKTTDLSGFASSTNLTSGATVGSFAVIASLVGTSATTTFNESIVLLGGFTIVPTSTQVGPLEPAASYTQNLVIVPNGGFSAPVALTCTAPSGITCTISPTIVPFTNGIAQLKPYLSFQSEGGLRSASMSASPWLLITLCLLAVATLRKRRSLTALLTVSLAILTLGGIVGCSGGQLYAPTTPDGTYTLTITGTAQTVTASTTVSYVIKH